MKKKNDLKGKKIVVTGGAGFIGSHIVDELVSLGAKVVVIDDHSTGNKKNLKHHSNNIKVVKGSINDTKKLISAFKDASAVVHLAAIPSVPRSVADPIKSHEANSAGTLSVFHAAYKAGVPRVVYSSSCSVYGDTPILPKVETMPTNPLSPYAVQKMTMELYAKIFHRLFGLETIGLRYFNVFGPRQDPHSEYSAVIPKFINLIKQGKKPTIYGDGEHTRDFTYIANVVDANINALTATKGFGDVYNIAAGDRISLNELIQKINKHLKTSIKPEYAAPRAGDIKDSFADITKARKLLGYEPKVSFEDGLILTIESI
ncbi:MAG: UDP-N-acetylglucosamine/UDP-N-acetylgalactosamine 4-epimerase [Patescibacteria group bacterium]|nr:UDP-N-acetylglucosamine/UDP-N-acetylgalactosamine 4-epimerase [Patescibacteria group bacterium]